MHMKDSNLRQVLKKLKTRGLRLQGIPDAWGKYLFTDQNGKTYYIKTSSLMNHRPANRKGTYRVWMIKVGDTDFDYLVCGLFKNDKLEYVTRAPRWAVNFKATMITETRVRARKGWDILFQGK